MKKLLQRIVGAFHRQPKCDHSHTFRLNLPPDTNWYSHGMKMGHHNALILHGCYKCGKVWCEDFAS